MLADGPRIRDSGCTIRAMKPEIRFCKTSEGVSIAYYAIGHGPAIVNMPMMPTTYLELAWKVDDTREGTERAAALATVVHYDGRGFGSDC
jgi:hypothetical protein